MMNKPLLITMKLCNTFITKKESCFSFMQPSSLPSFSHNPQNLRAVLSLFIHPETFTGCTCFFFSYSTSFYCPLCAYFNISFSICIYSDTPSLPPVHSFPLQPTTMAVLLCSHLWNAILISSSPPLLWNCALSECSPISVYHPNHLCTLPKLCHFHHQPES